MIDYSAELTIADDRSIEPVQTGRPTSNPFGVAPTRSHQDAAALAVEQRAIAEVQASFLMAEKFPRDERDAVDRIINAFSRPSLAERATYAYSRGGSDVTGPSIRAAEAIAQQWGNLDVGFSEIGRYKDEKGVGSSIVRVQCWDLQSRSRKYIEFHVRHWRDTKKGGYALKDERDIYELIANQAQRRVRACILANVPADVVETAMQQAETTLRANVETTPESTAKMVAAFEQFGVTKAMIESRIQRRIDAIAPGQVLNLKRIYASLRDDMSQPSDWFDVPANAPSSAPAAIAAMNQASRATRAPETRPRAESAPEKDPRQVDIEDVVASPEPAPSPQAAATPAAQTKSRANQAALTYAQVMDAINACETAEDLADVRESLVPRVQKEAHRAELAQAIEQRAATLSGGGDA